MITLKDGEFVWTGKPYEYGNIMTIEDDLIVVVDPDGITIDCDPQRVHKLPPFLYKKGEDLLVRKYDGFLYASEQDTKNEITYDEALRSGYVHYSKLEKELL